MKIMRYHKMCIEYFLWIKNKSIDKYEEKWRNTRRKIIASSLSFFPNTSSHMQMPLDIQKETCQPKCPSTAEWIKKMWYINTMEYYSVLKKEWNNAICSDMDSPRDYYTKWSKSDKDKHIMSLICGI